MDSQKSIRFVLIVAIVVVLIIWGWLLWGSRTSFTPTDSGESPLSAETQKSLAEVKAAQAPATTTTKKQVEEVKTAKPTTSASDLQKQMDSVANTPSPFSH